MELDLSSLKSVDKFVAEYKERGLPIHILLNNAAVMVPPFTLSADGLELQFATNHLVKLSICFPERRFNYHLDSFRDISD